MQLVIVTVMSGSGKSTVMKVMEDIGFYCIDNLPPTLIPKFVDVCEQAGGSLNKLAVAVDVRTGDMFSEIYNVLHVLKEERQEALRIVFMDTADDVLLTRYKETRRRHPLLEKCSSVEEAIRLERELLAPLHAKADYRIDTSLMSTSQLGKEIRDIFLENQNDSIQVKMMSFGFKYGISAEADLVFDVRCLPNPYYVPELRPRTGLESVVRDHVMRSNDSLMLFSKITDLLTFLLPLYIAEGKSQLVVAFGCTGGQHRSVTFAELVGDAIAAKGYRVYKLHRDITKGH